MTVEEMNNKKLINYFLSAIITLYLFYYMMAPLHHYLLYPLQWSAFFSLLIPVLFGMSIITINGSTTKEFYILVMLWIWIILTRIFNGDWLLKDNSDYVVFMNLMVLAMVPGILFPEENRGKYFNVVATAIILFFLILGLMGVYIGISHKELINPFDAYRSHLSLKQNRLGMLGFGSNETGSLFLVSFSLIMAMFVQYKKRWQRIFLVFAAVVDIIVIALTRSRNAQVNVCMVLGAFLAIIVIKKLKERRRMVRILCGLLVLFSTIILVYQVFEPCRGVLWQIHNTISQMEIENSKVSSGENRQEPQENEDNELQEEGQHYSKDNRSFLQDTGRIPIYISAFQSLKNEPSRLLIGCRFEDVMKYYNATAKKPMAHFHNMFLQILNLFGVPGLCMVFAFYYCILRKGFIMVFDVQDTYKTETATLLLPIMSISCFYLVEAGLFTNMGFCQIVFFIWCGALAGTGEKTA